MGLRVTDDEYARWVREGLVREDRPHRQDYRAMRQPKLRRGVTEAEFTEQVIDLAKLYGWRTAHFRAARTADGWRTPVSGDGKGFVDLVLVRERVLWVELKTDKGKLSAEQEAWSAVLKHAGCDVRLWRPRDWDAIVAILGGPSAGIPVPSRSG